MAHHVEPMDIDSDFDNKENSLHHNNVLPFTEKGYEELDVSELNMKLRYSITPASSPMSKSYTANSVDNRTLESGDDTLNATINENSNLTRSLNSNMTKNDSVIKSLKALPLQSLSTEQFGENNRSTSVLRPLDTTISQDNTNVTVTVSRPTDIDENVSLLSSSSSAVQTPEATTPTKDNVKNDGGSSPIMRGIKSVLNMFRSSQSPIPPADREDIVKPDLLSPVEATLSTEEAKSQALLASTPISTHRRKEASPTKRNSPNKESIVFNEDLETELQWKDETTILFSQERIPIHKLFFQHPHNEIKNANQDVKLPAQDKQDDMNSTVEYMDISYNDSIKDKTMTDILNKTDCTFTAESDAEFVDCETTFTKNDSLLEDNDATPVNDKTQDLDITKEIESTKENTSASRLKQIVLNTTQDILDATLSITPEDLLPEVLHNIQNKPVQDILDLIQQPENIQVIIPSDIEPEKANEINETTVFDGIQNNTLTSQENITLLNQTVDVMNLLVDKNNDSNVHITSENVINPKLDQRVEKANETNEITVYDGIQNNCLKSQENFTLLNQTVDVMNLSKDKNNDSNVHTTSENVIHPNLDQTVEVANPVISTEFREELNVTETIENILSETSENQHNSLECLNNSSSNEILLPNEKDLRRHSVNHNDSHLNQDITQDIKPNETGEDTINVHNSSNLTQATNKTIYNPEKLEEIVNRSLLVPDDDGKSSPIKEASMTELAAEIPLPDEDDLEKELNMSTDHTDASTLPNNLPLDLVDNITIQTGITEMIHDLTLEKEEQNKMEVEVKNEDTVLPEPPTLSTSNFAKSDNMHNEQTNPEFTTVLPEVKDIDDKNEEPPIIGEPQVVTVDVLPETSASLNINTESGEKTDQVQHDGEVINQTETVTQFLEGTVSNHSEENKTVSQLINITENVIELKPLPDIINQTIVLPNIESFGLAQINPELPVTTANDEIAKDSITDGTASIATENIPVVTDSIPDTQLNYVDVISTEPVMSDNEKQSIDTKDSVTKSADVKTEDDEIVLSENNSPFVSVVAEDIPGLKLEESSVVQDIDHRLATAGKVVYTPPASPPIASKGYNFNFDDIDDPFATKTKIRVSPSLDTPTKFTVSEASSRSVEKPPPKKEIKNRRKSQPERKKPVAPKRKFNSTYSDAFSDKTANISVNTLPVGDIDLNPPPNVTLEPNNVTIEDKLIEEAKVDHEITLSVADEVKFTQAVEPENDTEQPVTFSTAVLQTDESDAIPLKDSKSTSSSELSAYYSAGTSSTENFYSKNVFNIPEIDDKNFNPFATKSKMRQSPPPNLDTDNPFATKSKIRSSPDATITSHQNDEIVKAQDITTTILPDDKVETELMEKDVSGNLSNSTTSSKATDEKNSTVKEINTEDEDTIEGPFLETEDIITDDKMSDFDGENIDMMQFNDLPTQGNDENGDNGELFIDAEAFEFLLNQNKSNTIVDSGKESLFLKFDPLFAKRMSCITSESLVASLNKFQKRQSTPTKAAMPEQEVKTPIAGPSNLNITQEMNVTHNMDITHNLSEELNEDLNITISKPMMVVPPAVNPVTPRNKSLTPNRSNRRSITFTSPAMAVIDRLLSLSGNSSLLHDTTVNNATREQNEADLALTQLRELLAEKEINVYSLRSESKELKVRLTSLESHLKSLEEESQDRLKKINDLNDRLAEKTKINKSMAAVVEEYERTIASLISETAQDKKRHAEERIKLINERDEQTAHLASMEVSFSDLHSKYEKSKQVIFNCKANEDAYKKSIKEFEENLTKMQNNYELLKQHATSKLNHANQELEKMNKSHEAEVLKLNAMIKRKDLHITSLEESLAQKTKANEELTAICDELINKVG